MLVKAKVSLHENCKKLQFVVLWELNDLDCFLAGRRDFPFTPQNTTNHCFLMSVRYI